MRTIKSTSAKYMTKKNLESCQWKGKEEWQAAMGVLVKGQYVPEYRRHKHVCTRA